MVKAPLTLHNDAYQMLLANIYFQAILIKKTPITAKKFNEKLKVPKTMVYGMKNGLGYPLNSFIKQP